MIKLLEKAISIYHQKGYFLRWIDKRSLTLFLVFKKLIPRKKIKSDESPILVICDLLLGDLAISGFFFMKLKEIYPERRLILLCKKGLASSAKIFNFDTVVEVDYLSWKVLYKLRSLSPGGFSEVFDIFSSKWLLLLNGLSYENITSHSSTKNTFHQTVDSQVNLPNQPSQAVEIVMSLLGKDAFNSFSHKAQLNIPYSSFKFTKPYIIIHIGASKPARLWPIDLFEKVLTLSAKQETQILITGLRQQSDYENKINEIIEANNQTNKIINLMGKTTIQDLLSIVSRAKGLISVDTSIVHWARIFQTPNFSFLGQSDLNLFGSQFKFFKKSDSLGVQNLECHDRKTFHGMQLNWMSMCANNECPLAERHCFTMLDDQKIKLSLNRFLSSL
jgi:ADP-heptose:LPS heptosyltransferase